jgi:hypothetical protein
VLYQLSYAPRLHDDCIGASLGHDLGVGRYGMPTLFSVLTAAFAVIAVSSWSHGQWVIAVAAVAIGLWMGSFAWAALRRMRR